MPVLFYIAAGGVVAAIAAPLLFRLIAPRLAKRS